MARTASNRPTDAELATLRVLWQRGPSTVREVFDALNGARDQAEPLGYTTVLKTLQIMTEKGLVTRQDDRRTHVYRPAASEQKTQQHLVQDLLDRAFGGSAQKLILRALETESASEDELAEIRRLLEQRRQQRRVDPAKDQTGSAGT